MAVHFKPSVSKEKLRYYILRKPGHEMVPLVPADQLPFQLQDIPRQLSHRQLSDEGWRLLDETDEPLKMLSTVSSNQSHLQSGTPSSTQPRFRAPDHLVRGDVANVLEQTASGASRAPMAAIPYSLPAMEQAISDAHRSAITNGSNAQLAAQVSISNAHFPLLY
jgi:hypothetical protein